MLLTLEEASKTDEFLAFCKCWEEDKVCPFPFQDWVLEHCEDGDRLAYLLWWARCRKQRAGYEFSTGPSYPIKTNSGRWFWSALNDPAQIEPDDDIAGYWWTPMPFHFISAYSSKSDRVNAFNDLIIDYLRESVVRVARFYEEHCIPV